MVWVRLDDAFGEHPKIASLSDSALALWITGLAYCNRNLTDGFIPNAIGLGQLRYCDGNAVPAIRELEEGGLWDKVAGGWGVHDYPDYQPSKEQVLAEREAARERKAKSRRTSRRDKPSDSQRDTAVSSALPVPVPVPVPTTSKADLRSVPGNPFQPTHDQLYLASRMSDVVTPAVIVTWNKTYGVSEVTDVMRSLHQFATDVDDWVAYVRGTLKVRAEAM